MGIRVPFPPGLEEDEFNRAVEDLLRQTSRVKSATAMLLAIGVPTIIFLLAWAIFK